MIPMGAVHVLINVVDTDNDIDNRTCAMNCLNNMAIHLPASVLIDNEAVACALRVIKQQGIGASPDLFPVVFATSFCSVHS